MHKGPAAGAACESERAKQTEGEGPGRRWLRDWLLCVGKGGAPSATAEVSAQAPSLSSHFPSHIHQQGHHCCSCHTLSSPSSCTWAEFACSSNPLASSQGATGLGARPAYPQRKALESKKLHLKTPPPDGLEALVPPEG